jgi:hypothetical protein
MYCETTIYVSFSSYIYIFAKIKLKLILFLYVTFMYWKLIPRPPNQKFWFRPWLRRSPSRNHPSLLRRSSSLLRRVLRTPASISPSLSLPESSLSLLRRSRSPYLVRRFLRPPASITLSHSVHCLSHSGEASISLAPVSLTLLHRR